MKGNAQRGTEIAFGSFGIKALQSKWITSRQIEAARVVSSAPLSTTMFLLHRHTHTHAQREKITVLFLHSRYLARAFVLAPRLTSV